VGCRLLMRWSWLTMLGLMKVGDGPEALAVVRPKNKFKIRRSVCN
jgi:hypothetical protein